ncbi:MAG: ABC transporter ATP-binding protein [Thermotoga sp.]|nr:MAG: ABC transporter ATP-binding protein [Thermotoga sp.]
MKTLLKVKDFNAGYVLTSQRIHAVKNVTFKLDNGEFLGIAGESGCGKSTLALGIAGLLNPPGEVFSGEVEFDGKNLLKMKNDSLRKLRWKEFSIVFQSSMNVLNPVIKIKSQMFDAIQYHTNMPSNHLEERAKELLELVNVSPKYLEAYPHQLSGGMKQRVVIAMALSLNPKLIIMDEPTTALDVVVQRNILQEIDKLRKKFGFSIIFITHDLSLLVEISDTIAIMYAGQIVEKAPSTKLYAKPLHPYSYGLMHSFPPLVGKRQRLHGIAGHPPDLTEDIEGCPFFERCTKRINGVCDKAKPSFIEIEPGHIVACHLYDEEGESSAK